MGTDPLIPIPPSLPKQSPNVGSEAEIVKDQKIKANMIWGEVMNRTKLQPAPPQTLDPNRFKDWRSDKPPDLTYNPIKIDESPLKTESLETRKKVIEKCLQDYQKASESFEHSIEDAVLRYVHIDGNPKLSEQN